MARGVIRGPLGASLATALIIAAFWGQLAWGQSGSPDSKPAVRISDRLYKLDETLLPAPEAPRRAGTPAPVAKPPVDASIEEGRTLFEHRWDQGPPAGGKKGDGLGPVYNDASCAACHRQGGLGGGGGNEHDALLATVAAAKPRTRLDQVPPAAFQLHPDFRLRPTVLLHAHGTPKGYDLWRLRMLGQESDPQGEVRAVAHKGFSIQITRRNTTALFGAGLIDQIPGQVILDEAKRQAKESPATAGRPATSNPLADDPYRKNSVHRVEVGRFGWRGQISTLREFVLAACANELGLETPDHSQPTDPLDVNQALDPRLRSLAARGLTTSRPEKWEVPLDIDRAQCEDLVSLVSWLPRPKQRLPLEFKEVARVRTGERLFDTIGCAACHKPNLGEVTGLYSDLLLHDLGEGLSDPLAANPAQPPGTIVDTSASSSRSSSYYGGPTLNPVVLAGQVDPRQQWRTPPLWGVRDSAPYLHDGRAPTLATAIELHGGQGTTSRDAFVALTGDEQQALLLFLESLAAPRGLWKVQ